MRYSMRHTCQSIARSITMAVIEVRVVCLVACAQQFVMRMCEPLLAAAVCVVVNADDVMIAESEVHFSNSTPFVGRPDTLSIN